MQPSPNVFLGHKQKYKQGTQVKTSASYLFTKVGSTAFSINTKVNRSHL